MIGKILTESVYKTKTVLNKMMDLRYCGVEGSDLAAALLCGYYERLRQERRMKPDAQYFSDIRNGQRCIKKWRSFEDAQTPSTFEKYLLLSAIFGCDFRDIVFLECDDEKRPEGAYSFAFSFDTAQNMPLGIVTDLPCIRDKMGKDGIERFGYLASDAETAGLRRKISYDGNTVLDRALGFIRSNKLEAAASELIEKLDSVIFAWKTRRAPLSMGLILMFEAIMKMDILEMYVPEYLSLCADLSEFAHKAPVASEDPLRSLKAGNLARDKIRYFLEENNLEIYRIQKNCIITRRNGLFGLLLAGEDGIARHFFPRFDYVAGSGENLFAIENETAFRITTEDADCFCLLESAFCPGGRGADSRKEAIAAAIHAVVNGGYRYFMTDGGLIVMTPEGNAALARLGKSSEMGRTVKTYDKGRIYYGLIVRSDFVIPPVYEREIAAGEGIYTVKKQGKCVFLNCFGIPMETESFEDASAFSEGLCVVRRGRKYGYIDAQGREAIPFLYDFATDFREGLAAVTVDGKDGYIDPSGNMIVTPLYANAYRFSEGIAVVEKGGKYGYINKTGKEIFPCIYDSASACSGGSVQVLSCGNLITKNIPCAKT